MPNQKHAHGSTFHQAIVLSVIERQGPVTSAQVAAHYIETTGIDVAYNYQYIITRRMADKGLIRSASGKGPGVLRWAITPRGRRLLEDMRRLCTIVADGAGE